MLLFIWENGLAITEHRAPSLLKLETQHVFYEDLELVYKYNIYLYNKNRYNKEYILNLKQSITKPR